MNQLRISFKIVSKLVGHGSGWSSSCTNVLGLARATMIAFHWKQTLYGDQIPKAMLIKSRFGTFFATSCFGGFGLSVIWGCSTMNDGTNPRVNALFGMRSFCMLRRLGLGWLTMLRFMPTRPKHPQRVWPNVGARNILCKEDRMRVTWNWKRQRI